MKIILIRVFFYLALLVYVASAKKDVSNKDQHQSSTAISSKADAGFESGVHNQDSREEIIPVFVTIFN